MSRFSYLNTSKAKTGYDFFMSVDGAKMFEKNWDMELVMGNSGRQVVLSGSSKILFDKDNYKFYPKYDKLNIDAATETGWVVRDFFFMSFNLFKAFPDISMFKYYGMEEVYSMFAAKNGIPVVAIASAWVTDNEPNISEKDFVPFSLYHNYTKITDSFKNINEAIPGVDELSRITGYDFGLLEYFPYPRNDVEYNTKMNLDALSERRFHQTQKTLY
jgi:hypothetical protein